MLLHNGSEEKNQHGHSSGFLVGPGASAMAQSSSDDGPRDTDDKTAPACEEIEPFNINIPVFMERTFRMIDSVSDDIVCWSRAGDSFIVKKVLVFEQHLPSFFNHKKFLSFVRQLNFYGFRRVKGKSASRLSSADGGMHGAAAAAAAKESESWEEFIHPLFRRGRRDLLVGIKRHKDGGRLKRKQVDSQESGILSDLRADMDALRGDMRMVDGKLDNIMSLLLDMSTSDPRQPGPTNPIPQPQNAVDGYASAAGGGSGSSFERGGGSGGSGGSPATTSAASVRGGDREGLNQWRGGGAVGGGVGGIHPASQDPNAFGARLGHYMEPRLGMDQHQQGSERHQLAYLSQQPSPAQRTWSGGPARFDTRWREHGHYHH